MEYKLLGRTGVNVSCISLGTDNFADPTPEEEASAILNRALDVWINLIDTGDVYADGEGERIIGRTLKANGRRDHVLIATKVDHGKRRPGYSLGDAVLFGPNDHGHTRLNIIRACENSLQACDALVPPSSVVANFHNTADWMKMQVNWDMAK
ncbi:MAG: aldo/keto reductase [Gammaproteobacteria bacterium]|nr:aldo/keto reductase [Gammaproteobacteria bacterium]